MSLEWDGLSKGVGRELSGGFLLSVIILTPHLLVLSADNLCKQFGPRSGQTKS